MPAEPLHDPDVLAGVECRGDRRVPQAVGLDDPDDPGGLAHVPDDRRIDSPARVIIGLPGLVDSAGLPGEWSGLLGMNKLLSPL